jgi:transcriptional regulator with XRE-family HTH domain
MGMFYEAFLKLCNSVDKTPSAVGRELGISKTTINFWKTGRNNPSDRTILKIADYFKVDYKALKEGRVVPVQSGLDNIQTAITDWMKEEEQRMNETKEFAIKYSQLTEVQKKLVSDLIDTFLSDSK